MNRNQVQKYKLDELTIRLADAPGSLLDSVYGMEIDVNVEFDYDAGEADCDDLPAIYNMAVKIAGGAQLGNDFIKLDLEDGFDLTRYLDAKQEDRIEEYVLAKMAELNRDENEAMQLHAAGV